MISESVFKNSERRTDLDKAYHHLIRVVFINVERMAEEHQKTPRAVVMMGEQTLKQFFDFHSQIVSKIILPMAT